LITQDQIADWIKEIEQRPASSGAILRAITARLVELDKWNAELLTDNIELRSGNRVEEYEARIAALEYQIELLKRQPGAGSQPAQTTAPAGSLLLFQPSGRVLRLALRFESFSHAAELARFDAPLDPSQPAPGMLFAHPAEELLFVFDSGRTVTLDVEQLPFSGPNLDWRLARRIDPRPGEELSAVMPLTDLPHYESCVQISRRACAKLMPRTSFQSLLARGSIGAGIKRRPDKTAGLTFCARDGRITLATREGWLLTLPADRVPYTVDELMQLSASDYVAAVFSPAEKSQLVFLTNNARVIHRDADWLEPAVSFKSRGQAILSPARRDAGVRIVGAAAASIDGWGVVLRSDGVATLVSIASLISSGVLEHEGKPLELAGFALLGLQKQP